VLLSKQQVVHTNHHHLTITNKQTKNIRKQEDYKEKSIYVHIYLWAFVYCLGESEQYFLFETPKRKQKGGVFYVYFLFYISFFSLKKGKDRIVVVFIVVCVL
jgi:hypothetical protein